MREKHFVDNFHFQNHVRCRKCNNLLGYSSVNGAIKVLKTSVALLDAASQLIPLPPISAFVAQDLIHASQMHTCRHFLLESEQEDGAHGIRIWIWLFVDIFFVSFSPFRTALQVETEDGSCKATKVLYHISHDNAATSTPNWSAPGSHERLTYPQNVCKILLDTLQAANRAYPPNQRTLATHWQQSFLPLQS